MLNIAVDGGGSKLLALAFDEEGSILSVGKGSSVNAFFASDDEVTKTIIDCIESLLNGIPEEVPSDGEYVFDDLYMTMAGPSDRFVEYLNKKAVVRNIHYLSEGAVGLLAGALSADGLLALSGTGSDCFLNRNSVSYAIVGGWGAAFGDEGSGYWMGCETIRAAIRSYDGRGEKSVLEKLVMEQYSCHHMWDIARLYTSKSQRKDIAAASRSLSEAVWMGDRVATKIVLDAADIMAEQSLTLLRTKNPELPMKFTVAGGGWKTSGKMIDRYVNRMVSEYPQLEFVYPCFEPVAGGVIEKVLRTSGPISAEKLEDLKLRLADYRFYTDDDRRKMKS